MNIEISDNSLENNLPNHIPLISKCIFSEIQMLVLKGAQIVNI